MGTHLDSAALTAEQGARLSALHTKLTEAVSDLASSAGWQRMLTIAARMPTYSINNVLLIAAQRPDATHVAGYQAWRSAGRHVLKGQKGIAILAPCLYTPPEDTPATGTPGPQPESTAAARVLRGFRVVHVFNVDQTDGQPLPDTTPRELHGPAPAHLVAHLEKLVRAAGFTVERGPCGGAYGHTRYDDRTVRIRDDVDPAQAAKTLAHELGHIRADHEHRYLEHYQRSPECRGAAEVEAESIAYLVTTIAGLDTSTYSVPYLTGWAYGDTTLLQASAQRVVTVAHAITASLDPPPPPQFAHQQTANRSERQAVQIEPENIGVWR